MNSFDSELEATMNKVTDYFSHRSEKEISHKPSENKWSKKEMLGHLIDSGINNLQRFTEIQFMTGPYVIRDYRQSELVEANDYQHAETKEILNLYEAINTRILQIIKKQKDDSHARKIILPEGNEADLRFLIEDYISHMRHHLKQILN